MSLQEKVRFVEDIRERFEAAPLVVLTDFRGCTVQQMDKLRRACEPIGVRYQVVKNTLCRRALEGTDKEELSSHFRGNVGVFFAGEDPIAAAKLLKQQLKENEKLEVKAGFFEGTVLDDKQVVAVADFPSREELLAKLLQTAQAGPQQVLGVVQGGPRDLLAVLNNHAAKLEGAS